MTDASGDVAQDAQRAVSEARGVRAMGCASGWPIGSFCRFCLSPPMPLKVGEMIKLLEADGWYLVWVRGSHRHYRHATKPGTAIVAGKPSETLRPMTERAS